ncbi:hypothetical protein EI94DRAFT_1707749 [Lactarius quietus]|nr:hypothetical protein EI94DRAFT_1707749 [Lactarius quietus]
MNKVKEKIMSVANNFKKFVAERNKNLKKPHIHPIIQVMSREWKKAEEESRTPNWSIFTTDYISEFCKNQRASEPDWHSDLSSLDLGPYMEGLQDHKKWWDVGLPAPQDDEDVPMDPPALLPLPCPPAAPPTTAPPSMPVPQAPTCSSKGKAHALPPLGSSDPRSALTTLPAPPAPLPAPTPSATPAAPYVFRGARCYAIPQTGVPNTETAQDNNNNIEDFDTTPCKRGSPPDASLSQVHVDDTSPPLPVQQHWMEVRPPVATGNDRCGPCRNPKNKRPECIAQTNPKHLTFVCTFCAGRRKHCTLPALWVCPVVRLMASQGVALPEDIQGTLSLSDEGGSSHHSPMSLRSLSGTPGEDLVSRVNSLEGKMDYIILVLNAIAERQGIVPSSLPGYIQLPPSSLFAFPQQPIPIVTWHPYVVSGHFRCSYQPSFWFWLSIGLLRHYIVGEVARHEHWEFKDVFVQQAVVDHSVTSCQYIEGKTVARRPLHAAKVPALEDIQDAQHTDSATTYQVNQNIQHRGQHSPVMLSDPSNGSSSDAQSFDEDDMYGSDSGIQSISMKPHSEEKVTISNEVQMGKDQNTEISTQVQRMDINMGNVSIIMDALCEAEGIDISSIANLADNQAATTSHMPSYLEGSNDGNET